MNTSINEMLARTIITGVTTLIVLSALLVLGGESVGPFSIALDRWHHRRYLLIDLHRQCDGADAARNATGPDAAGESIRN